MTREACKLLAEALRVNRAMISLDLTDTDVEEGGLEILKNARPDGELELAGVWEEYYS